VGVCVAVGEGVAVGCEVAVAVAVGDTVGDAVTVGVAEAKTVAVHVVAGSTVGGSLGWVTTFVSTGLGEIGGRLEAVQPHTRASTSIQPRIIRALINPSVLQVTTHQLASRGVPPLPQE
jgi:hypothetical protein